MRELRIQGMGSSKQGRETMVAGSVFKAWGGIGNERTRSLQTLDNT
jgi:hypothetical protein